MLHGVSGGLKYRGRFTQHNPTTSDDKNLSVPSVQPTLANRYRVQFPSISPQSERVYTLRIADEIFREFHDRTDMQAQRAVNGYLGKWLRVVEVIGNISEYEGTITVTLSRQQYDDVFLVFSKDRWQDILETVRDGDTIKAEGRIRSIGRYTMFLCDCEVTELSRPQNKGSQCTDGFSATAEVQKRPSKPQDSDTSGVPC